MKIIKRPVSRSARFLEVIESMPNPIITIEESTRGVPQIIYTAINKDGICLYRYVYMGLLGMKEFKQKVQDLL
jgi:hypothetical protein